MIYTVSFVIIFVENLNTIVRVVFEKIAFLGIKTKLKNVNVINDWLDTPLN